MEVDTAGALDRLRGGEVEVVERMPWSSNATFLACVSSPAGSGETLVIYKPQQGERPLWDFERGTLCAREAAAFEVSEALGWAIVPPTVLRDGPFGMGMVQLFVDHDPDEHYLELRDDHPDRFRQIAAFDVVINNADRKSGHCILDRQGHIWGIDHGVSFHVHHKLRTVIWDHAGDALPSDVVSGLEMLDAAFDDGPGRRLTQLLTAEEAAATRARVQWLLDEGRFPEPRGDYPYPWPLV